MLLESGQFSRYNDSSTGWTIRGSYPGRGNRFSISHLYAFMAWTETFTFTLVWMLKGAVDRHPVCNAIALFMVA
jgi:hypothetical protein